MQYLRKTYKAEIVTWLTKSFDGNPLISSKGCKHDTTFDIIHKTIPITHNESQRPEKKWYALTKRWMYNWSPTYLTTTYTLKKGSGIAKARRWPALKGKGAIRSKTSRVHALYHKTQCKHWRPHDRVGYQSIKKKDAGKVCPLIKRAIPKQPKLSSDFSSKARSKIR